MLPILLAPSTSGETNTVRDPLDAVACWSIGDVRFEFDSSFVKREACNEMPLLARLIARHSNQRGGPPVSLFGHADPVGNDDYNKRLSGRRAAAVFGLLTRDIALWEDLFSNPFAGDTWGPRSIGAMLSALGHDGPAAVREFQMEHGLSADGIAGPITRSVLFPSYMDAICVDTDGQPFKLAKSDFLARGADSGGKGDFQGCGELNPFLLLSNGEVATLPKTKRDAENTPNRRVVAFLFKPGAQRSPDQWPCPRASEGAEKCQLRLFSDHAARRVPGPARRRYSETQDTFACRFYDRLSRESPCEGLRNRRILELTLDDTFFGPCAGNLVEVTFADGSSEQLATDQQGAIFMDAARGPFADVSYERQGFRHRRRVFMRLKDASTTDGAWQRLVNMGYVHEGTPPEAPATPVELARAIFEFQLDHRMDMSGVLDGVTIGRIRDAYADQTPWRDREWLDTPAPGPTSPTPKSDKT